MFYIHDDLDPTDSFDNCCKSLFGRKPFFNTAGTCFSTQEEIVETFPATFSSLKIWLNFNRQHLPSEWRCRRSTAAYLSISCLLTTICSLGFDILVRGSDAAERSGGYWSLSQTDHPSSVLITRPQRIARGKTAIVSIDVTEVK